MIWTDLFAAFALFLVFEGLLPFINPAGWRKSMLAVIQLKDGQLRMIGMISIGFGLALLLFIRSA